MRWLCWLLLGTSLGAQAETFDAKVIAVMDGDTVMVLRGGQKLKVRLANIDAPEVAHAGLGDTSSNSQKDQAYGPQSRDSLLQMVGRRVVRVESQAVDQYGRIVGLLQVDGLNVNAEQVKRGLAWEYSRFHSNREYIALQAEAQQARRGLWAQQSPEAPWLWRKALPASKWEPQSMPSPKPGGVFYDAACGNKKRCAQMASCGEADFYLHRCGLKALDENRNGMPCESLCKGKK